MNKAKRIVVRYLPNIVEFSVFLMSFILINVPSILGNSQFPDVGTFTGKGWKWVPMVAVIILVVLLLIKLKKLTGEFLDPWRRNPFLAAFLFIAVCSLAWSVYFQATLFKLPFLLLATLLGTYIATRYDLDGILEIVTWAAGFSVVFSMIVVIFSPNGIMYNEPYTGSWRGMFWHRNHMGNLTAYFNAIFLFRLLHARARSVKTWLIEIGFYLLSFALVVGSKSATGIVVLVCLHFFLAVCNAWIRQWHRIETWHYYAIGGLLILAAVIFFTNVGFFFGLLGRSANMTGRIPLWEDLLMNIWTERPWFGYGYGALWMQKDFRFLMMQRQGWMLFPVFFADNGYLDILLNLGLAGFMPFVIMQLSRALQSCILAIKSKRWIVFFLPLTFTYVFVGNIAYSFLLEVEQFVWMLLVVAVMATTRLANDRILSAD